MKILFALDDGSMVAMDAVTVIAGQQPDDDKWCVMARPVGQDGWSRIACDLTEKDAKNVVRKLFDYGVYTGV